jgi:hypothetical protein
MVFELTTAKERKLSYEEVFGIEKTGCLGKKKSNHVIL